MSPRKKLGQSFAELKNTAREIPEVKDYLDSFSVTIGHLVLSRRLQLGYSQSKLAKLAQTTQARISMIESGDSNITSEVLNKVFHILEIVNLQAIYAEEKDTNPELIKH
ncbi:helix-turn-helix transcriptional regulator [Paenibacillus sp. PsM32]|uniref:helix-turn-helix domain-containing protein n=1 Tax=Paenibacillus sp. PsM32 TaxID=3030536 RepID=UPI00263B2308|nr:helix-turn-helix transcriptional regulator [Paenibacillus sp. PsM32]MDN4617263.1 helix-turn-helix transcriptional regulator [Paenibacillus sp. PsM32]